VNARLSEKSLQQALRAAWLARPAYQALTAVWAQSEEDAQRLRQLGAKVQGVLGNLKYDATPDAAQLELGRQWRTHSAKPVVMFASSREGEEALWLEALKKEPRASEVQWLLVPRHPQRFAEVAQLCDQAAMPASRRSTWTDAPQPAHVWLGDSLGEMALYFGLADVALLGGSFAPLGGQNLIEAAACECPVVMGPHTFNFAQAAEQALRAGAALRVEDMANGVERAIQWACGKQALNAGRKAARRVSATHRGAAARTAQAVAALLRG
jgi:3-deoxy-D-manno-octulosonic-acid transferase